MAWVRRADLTAEMVKSITAAGRDASPSKLGKEVGLGVDQVRYLQIKLGLRDRGHEWGKVTAAHAKRVRAWQAELDAVEPFLPEVDE